MTVKKLTTLALLTAVALIIHTAEALVPIPLPLPGVKPGLANIVTLFMLFMPLTRPASAAEAATAAPALRGVPLFKAADVVAVLLCRIILAAFVAGRPAVILYSLSGGVLAVASQITMKRFVSDNQMWVCGAVGAVFHNIGQILAAVVILGTPAVAVYLPVLIIAGIVTGTATGLLAQLAVKRFKILNIRKN